MTRSPRNGEVCAKQRADIRASQDSPAFVVSTQHNDYTPSVPRRYLVATDCSPHPASPSGDGLNLHSICCEQSRVSPVSPPCRARGPLEPDVGLVLWWSHHFFAPPGPLLRRREECAVRGHCRGHWADTHCHGYSPSGHCALRGRDPQHVPRGRDHASVDTAVRTCGCSGSRVSNLPEDVD